MKTLAKRKFRSANGLALALVMSVSVMTGCTTGKGGDKKPTTSITQSQGGDKSADKSTDQSMEKSGGESKQSGEKNRPLEKAPRTLVP